MVSRTPAPSVPPPPPLPLTGLLAELQGYGLLRPAQLAQLRAETLPRLTTPRDLGRELLRRDWLTAYQVNQLLQGRCGELLLGGYVLLERLGQGGMGAVFKARHQKLDRVVALKLIRKERVANAAAVRRFLREIQAAAQLEHPNIVRAYDAEQLGRTR
jgi:serine/threonine-protein kinase